LAAHFVQEILMLRSPLRVLALAVFAAAGLTGTANAEPADQGKHIDVVLCLDVSGSMEGLVNQAKVKLWDLVNELAKVKPTPQLRVGLYSYGHNNYDPKAGWVRKDSDLTTDLDEVYKKLNALTIFGGEEYVARVCHDALTEQKWAEGKDALRLIFVCGNEPVDQDKQVHLNVVADLAKKKNVIINTIYCNWNHPEEIGGWRDFAKDAGGKFAMIEHNQKLIQIETPYDKALLGLNTKLNSTYTSVSYGAQRAEKSANQSAQDQNAALAGAPVAAARVATKGGALYKCSEWCLVDRLIEDPNFDITKVPEDQLCDELKKLKPQDRVEYVKKKKAEREAIQKEIGEVSAKRGKFVAEEMKKRAGDTDKALDTALRGMIREQAGAKGIQIPE
jgi:hypothetical protein